MDLTAWNFFIKCFTSLLAILNPIGALPVFLALDRQSGSDRMPHVILTASLSVMIILLIFVFFGESLLRFFGISLPAFRISGGILLLLMAISMLQGQISPAKHTPEETAAAADRHSIAVVPLATPILAGPGSISAVILLGNQAADLAQWIALVGAIVLNSFLVYVILFLAEKFNSWLGVVGIKIISRIMGLVLAALAVQFISDGLSQMYPVLAK